MSNSKRRIELIVRGAFIHANQLLLCRNIHLGHVFLPGGHIDFGEPARNALEREILEELGALSAGDYLGCLEAGFDQISRRTGRSKRHHELNLIFALDLFGPAAFDPSDLLSAEPDLQFIWRPIEQALHPTHPNPVLPFGIEHIIARHRAVTVLPGAQAWRPMLA